MDRTLTQTRVLFGFAFLTAATYVVTRTVAMSSFLARVGTENLPACIAAAAISVIVVSGLSARLVRRVSPSRLIIGSWITLAVVSVLFAIASRVWPQSPLLLGGLYVFAEIRGCLNTMHVVSLTNEAFAESETTRPFAVVASGSPVAGVVTGLLLSYAPSAGLIPLLLTVGGLDLLSALLVLWKRRALIPDHRRVPRDDFVVSEQFPATRSLEPEDRSYRLQLSALVALKIVVLTLVGYQWKVAVGNFYGEDEVSLVAYFALFYAISDIIIVLLQWLVTGSLLDRFGIGLGLIGFPLTLAAVGVLALLTDAPGWLLLIFTLGKGLQVVRRAVHDPALAVAYTVLAPQIRRETILVVKGMIKPLSEATTAIALLLVGAALSHLGVTALWLVCLPVWVWFALRAVTGFRKRDV